MSLARVIGTLPNGQVMAMGDDAVAKWIRDNYFTKAEERRTYRAWRRELFYLDAGDEYLNADIDRYFKDPEVKSLRKTFTETAKFNNVIRRLCHEISTVYSRPARREVSGASDNERYQEVLRFLRFDLVMREVNRMMTRHRQLLVQVRVRRLPDGRREPVIDLVHPGAFSALAHPVDGGMPIGYRIDFEMRAPEGAMQASDVPAHIVWDDTDVFNLNAQGHFISGSKRAHGFERLPLVLVSANTQSDRILDQHPNESWVAGHRAVWLQNVLGLKESKSQNNQTAFIGDMSRVPTGQTADSESDLILGEDVTTQTIARGVDLAQFRDMADHILERLAANEGIPPSVLRHEGATSGFEIELRRIGIREIRRAQEVVLRAVERELVEVMAMVFARDLPEFAFDPDGFSINFGEVETPLSDKERLDVFELERRLGVSNTLELIKERDPDLTSDEEAEEVLRHNIEVETMRNLEMRVLQKIQGSMDAGVDETADIMDGEAARAAADMPDGEPMVDEAVAPAPQEAQPPQGAPPEAAVAEGQDVQQAALNGAQVAAMVDIVVRVNLGELSRPSAKALILAAFPVTEQQAEAILGPENPIERAPSAADNTPTEGGNAPV